MTLQGRTPAPRPTPVSPSRPRPSAHRLVRILEVLVAGGLAAALALGALLAVRTSGHSRHRVDLSVAAQRQTAQHRTGPSSAGTNTTSGSSSAAVTPTASEVLHAEVLSPAAGSTGVSPTAAVTVRFSAPLTPGSAMPTLSPPLQGSWKRVSSTTWRFTPTEAALPLSTESVTVPAGLTSSSGADLSRAVTASWKVRNGSVLGLQEVLAELGYLPLNWTRTKSPQPAATSVANTAVAEMYSPPAGHFTWRYPNTPPQLQAAWKAGTFDRMTAGAMVAFEIKDRLPGYTSIRPQMWAALLTALEDDTTNPEGYTYALVSQALPESLTLWHDGVDVETFAVNTGINGRNTPVGNFFVYRRFVSTTMSGENPNGTYYDDHGVRWVNYFDGGVAIHGFVRASYGFPQSLGCVELPLPDAQIAYQQWLHYGTLVTVEPEPAASRAASA